MTSGFTTQATDAEHADRSVSELSGPVHKASLMPARVVPLRAVLAGTAMLVVAATLLAATGWYMRSHAMKAPLPPLPMPYSYVELPNCDERPSGATVNCIVLHSTVEPTTEGTMNIFLAPEKAVSAHFVVGRDGRVVQMVPVEKRAWHAGVSVLDGVPKVNDYSVGIEMVNLNDGKDPYTPAQMEAVAGIIRLIRSRLRRSGLADRELTRISRFHPAASPILQGSISTRFAPLSAASRPRSRETQHPHRPRQRYRHRPRNSLTPDVKWPVNAETPPAGRRRWEGRRPSSWRCDPRQRRAPPRRRLRAVTSAWRRLDRRMLSSNRSTGIPFARARSAFSSCVHSPASNIASGLSMFTRMPNRPFSMARMRASCASAAFAQL